MPTGHVHCQHHMTGDLNRLLRPKSIAMIGGGWAANAIRACQKMGYDGEIWPIHPTKPHIAGHTAYAALSDLPSAPDAAFVAVNRDASIKVIAELSAMGAGGSVSFASGFAETGDAERQAALVGAAGDMPVLGPNCYGFINYLDGALLWPDQQGGKRVKTGVAIISQSSNIAINMTMAARGLPIAYVVCVGNQAQTDMADIARSLSADPRVTAVGLYIEGIADPLAFFEMTRTIVKPVIAIKAGRSEAAQIATISHTASMAGSDAASSAFFARCTVPLVHSIPEFLETLKLLHIRGPMHGNEICSISCSGGEATLMADAAEGRALTFPAFSPDDRVRIQDTLSDLVTIANPLDYHTFIWGDEAKMASCFSAVMATGFDLTLFVVDFPRSDRCSTADWTPLIAAIKAAAKQSGQHAAIVTSLHENLPEEIAEEFAAACITPLFGFDEALAAIEAAAKCTNVCRAARAPLGPGGPPADAPPPTLWNEADGKAEIARYDIAIPEGQVADTPKQVRQIAITLAGPVALKRLGIAHKTEQDAVSLNLLPETVIDQARAMGRGPYLVERMIDDRVAELIIGVHRDTAYGLIVTIGSGGVLAELLDDTITLIPPVSADEAKAALLALKLAPLLTGYRGRPPADVDAAASAVCALSTYVVDNQLWLEELDINPLIVTQTGAIAADVLIRTRKPRNA